MSLLDVPTPPTLTKPRPHRMTVFEYEQLVSTGALEGQRVELLDGEMIDMPPMSIPHAGLIMVACSVLGRVIPEGYCIRSQSPFRVPGRSLPEPDVAVVPGRAEDYVTKQATQAALTIEICISTEPIDRGVKPFLYAAAAVPEYWLIHVRGRTIEVFRSPMPDSTSATGYSYGEVKMIGLDGVIQPLFNPAATIRVNELLPVSLADDPE
ncbi:MAG TPA: Uma2 family endonuclease [Tepidisphaeraceae bacterium]|nr:Uma2 family endonuclease [Tepidisphaeraceae bacterium]